MNQEIWQQLLSLESRDITQQWFSRIHARELNARRANEINAAAKQAREYFRNASDSDYSVRPLLSFYGVASLSRALLLLMKAQGGEEGLSGSHGLEALNWGATMSGNTAEGLRQLRNLKIRTCSGLFSDFMTHTKNRLSIHVRSAAVDWSICYDIPEPGKEVSLDDLLSRIPDLNNDYTNLSGAIRYASVNEMTFTSADGFKAKVQEASFAAFRSTYEAAGYTANCDGTWCNLECGAKTFRDNIPLFVHTYVNKMLGAIPSLYIAEPFPNAVRFSQLSITYMLSYVLGMLVRYYPTRWVSLIQGAKGDELWPSINRAQHYVEQSYPELVAEMVAHILKSAESDAEQPTVQKE